MRSTAKDALWALDFFAVQTAKGVWLQALFIIAVHTRELLDLRVHDGWDVDSVWTIRTFNEGARRGVDTEFARGTDAYQRFNGAPGHLPNPCVAPLETPPYYAVRLVPGDIGTFAGLKTDAFRRVTAGKLPHAHVAFLDEIFKANSAVLNSLLSSVNERVFHDDGQAKPIPLVTCVGASNELPDSQDLAAIYDRFVMRFHVDPISDQSAFLSMLSNEPREPAPPISFEEWGEIRKQVDAVTIPQQAKEMLFSLRSNLAPGGIQVSDRRWVKATKILRAQAWMVGSSSVSASHFQVLSDMLWDRPDQLPTIQQVVGQMSSTETVAAKRIMDSMHALAEQTRGYQGAQWSQAAANMRTELKKAIMKIESYRDQTTDDGIADELDVLIEELREQGKALTAKLREDLNMGF